MSARHGTPLKCPLSTPIFGGSAAGNAGKRGAVTPMLNHSEVKNAKRQQKPSSTATRPMRPSHLVCKPYHVRFAHCVAFGFLLEHAGGSRKEAIAPDCGPTGK